MSRHPSAALWIVVAMLCAGGALAQRSPPADEESAKDIVATTVRSLRATRASSPSARRATRRRRCRTRPPGCSSAPTPATGCATTTTSPPRSGSSIERRWLSLPRLVVSASARTSSPRRCAASEMNSTLTGFSSVRTRAKVATSPSARRPRVPHASRARAGTSPTRPSARTEIGRQGVLIIDAAILATRLAA